MSTTSDLLRLLLEKRREDGGWPYRQGASWTEPTAFALLALQSAGYSGQAVSDGQGWLCRNQNSDGGWAAAPSIGKSSSVTSAVLLAIPHSDLRSESGRSGLRWLIAQESAQPNLFSRWGRWFTGNAAALDREGGVPWVPETSAWVIPTCMTVLALRRALRFAPNAEYNQRLQAARQFLLKRRLPDSGWNHGGYFAAHEHVASYPETTGLALLALAELPTGVMKPSLHKAESFLAETRSAEAYSSLRLGLAAQQQRKEPVGEFPFRCWTTVDIALALLTQTMDLKTNPLVGSPDA